jgi:tetratricopeptide (TPR) repeat protein
VEFAFARANERCFVVSHRFRMKRVLLLLALLPASIASAAGAETLQEKNLREIVARERALFAKAEAEGDDLDEPRFAGEAKSIAAMYDVFIGKNPGYVPGLVTYGLFLAKLDMNRAAAAMLLRANKLDPNLAVVKNQLAKLVAEDGKPVEALPYITAAIDLEPKEALYHYHLGRLLLAAKDDFIAAGEFTRPALDKAMLEAFARAAELAPNNWEFAVQHAKAYYEVEPPQWDAALAAWDKLAAKATTPALRELMRLHRANVLVQAGRPAEARIALADVRDPQLAAEKQRVLDALGKADEK